MNWKSIVGWLSDDEAKALQDTVLGLPDSPTVVELGSFLGRSTCVIVSAMFLLPNAGRFYAVDRWLKTQEVNPGENLGKEDYSRGAEYMADFIKNMQQAGIIHFIQPIRLLTKQAARIFDDASIDMIFHDASHDEESVYQDAITWIPKLKSGGAWVHHDFQMPGGRVIEACGQLSGTLAADSIWVGKKL